MAFSVRFCPLLLVSDADDAGRRPASHSQEQTQSVLENDSFIVCVNGIISYYLSSYILKKSIIFLLSFIMSNEGSI